MSNATTKQGQGRYKIHMSNTSRARNQELIELARKACKKFGGQAEIGDGYAIVDTRKFKVVERNE